MMMIHISKEKLTEAILYKIQETIRSFNEYDPSQFGVPPKYSIVKNQEPFGISTLRENTIKAVWKVSSCERIRIEDVNIQPIWNRRDGMFYPEGLFIFTIHPALTQVTLEWQVGPRYGRGYQWDVSEDGSFYNERQMWAS